MSASTDATAAAPAQGFDRHTAVDDEPIGPWRAEVAPELSGFAGAHGGYMAAIALRALTRAVCDPQRAPRSLMVHLLASVAPGAVDLHARLDRAGSTMSAASLRIERDGATLATALGSFGTPRESLSHCAVTMPDVPAPEKCPPIVEKPVAQARTGLLAELLVWMRLLEDRPTDALSACMLADAAPPALYGRLSSYVAMPSTDITVHFADLAASERSPWMLGVFRTRLAADGYAVEDGELWTPDARLLLSARQQRRILTA
jgi:acyl-CoA thioesterase